MNQKNKPVEDCILLRGLARASGHWGDFPALLQKSLPHVRVHTIDLPGAGIYSGMKSPLTISEITNFLREKVQEEDRYFRSQKQPAIERVHLIATSLGGMVAADWMQRYSDDFVTCTVINSSFRNFSPIYRRLSPPSYRFLAEAMWSGDTLARESVILRMISNRPEIYEAKAKEWAEISDQRPMSRENALRQLVAAARFSCDLKHPPCPVLVLNSRRDRMVSPSCSEAIASRWGAELRQHPTAGHDLPLDEPQWVVERIKEFTQIR